MNIVFFVSDDIHGYNSSHFRVSIPAQELMDRKLANVKILDSRQWMARSPVSRDVAKWADVIIVQRVMTEDSWKHGQEWASAGKLVYLDFDDAYDLIGEENAAYSFWGAGEVENKLPHGYVARMKLDKHPVEQLKEGLVNVTGAVTPSWLLAKDWSKFSKKCVHVPNYLDHKRYWGSCNPQRKDRIVLGWGGSMSHLTSFKGSGIEVALNRILKKYNGYVILRIVGDERVVRQIPFHSPYIEHIPYVTFHSWTHVLNQINIGLAPLSAPYDARRSDLKVKEYLAMGIPFVASLGAPYSQLREPVGDYRCGIFVDQGELESLEKFNPDGWYEAIDQCVQNYTEMSLAAERAKQDLVPIYSIEHNIYNWIGGHEK